MAGITGLHIAFLNCEVDRILYTVQLGTDPKVLNDAGDSPIFYAMNKWPTVKNKFFGEDVARFFAEFKHSLSSAFYQRHVLAPNKAGKTIFHWAASKPANMRKKWMRYVLVVVGANPFCRVADQESLLKDPTVYSLVFACLAHTFRSLPVKNFVVKKRAMVKEIEEEKVDDSKSDQVAKRLFYNWPAFFEFSERANAGKFPVVRQAELIDSTECLAGFFS